MFLLSPPQILELNMFSRMPNAFRRADRCEWGDANRGGAVVDSFLEGPVLDGIGNLYVTDVPWGRIFRIDPAGEWRLIAEYAGDRQTLLIADYQNGLMRLDIRTGDVQPYLMRRNSERFKGVNDLCIDKAGNVYFTDQGQTGLHDPTGRLYRLRQDGRLDLLLSNVPSPNGVVLSTDERVAFVAVTRGNCVWRVPLLADGGVSKVGQFFTSYGPGGPDGLAVDANGRLYVANPGLGYVWVLNARAEPVLVLRGTPGASLTNIVLSQDGSRIYVTDSSQGAVLFADIR
jgi:gluconolactonase